MMKIGIFGGTFNPIHYGHLRAAEEVHEIFALNKILFIPAGRPPFKKPKLIPAGHRYEMVRIAIEGNPFFDISDIEVRRRGVSYSVDTLRSLKDKYKGAEFFFILGTDAFPDLPSWKEPDKLLSLTNLIVISRPEFPFSALPSSPYLKGVSKKALRELDRGTKETLPFSIHRGGKVFLCKITGLDISASCLRRLIRTGKDIKYLLPQAVESYIISHKLYIRNK